MEGFFSDLLFPMLGLVEDFGADLWDWITDRRYENIVGLNGLVWIKRKYLRMPFFPRGWMR